MLIQKLVFGTALAGITFATTEAPAQSFKEAIAGAWIVTSVFDEYSNGEKKDRLLSYGIELVSQYRQGAAYIDASSTGRSRPICLSNCRLNSSRLSISRRPRRSDSPCQPSLLARADE